MAEEQQETSPSKETDLAEVLDDLTRRLGTLEQHFSNQGINDLAHAIEQRIISRMRYGRNPQIELRRNDAQSIQ